MEKYFRIALVAFWLLYLGMMQIKQVIADEAGTRYKKQEDVLEPVKGLPLEEIRVFAEMVQIIKVNYYQKIDTATLLNYALKGMVRELDPHSTYLKASEFKDLEITTSGQYGGIGIEATMESGFIRVVSPIDDTPAANAGVLPGDLIVKINGVSVKGMSLNDGVEKMRGRVGESVKLSVLRENKEGVIDISIKRAIIKVKSIKSKLLTQGYVYIRISQFQADTDKELLRVIKEFQNKNGNLQGLVLDLRNNPGGVLQSAVGVADVFIEKGVLVYTEGRVTRDNLRFHAKKEGTILDIPLVVLINGGSASASEIVAGAIQDHKRGVILGERSFGKGSVQTIRPLSVVPNRGVKLTTALYYTPLGRSIQAEGIEPDIFVEQSRIVSKNKNGRSGYNMEANLLNHINNRKKNYKEGRKKGNIKQEKNKEVVSNDKVKILQVEKKMLEKMLLDDYQLYQALLVLRGMKVQFEVSGSRLGTQETRNEKKLNDKSLKKGSVEEK